MRWLSALAAFLAAFIVCLSSAEEEAECDMPAGEENGLRSGFRSEKVVSLKPNPSLVPEHELSSIDDIQETPEDALPGIVSELAKGFDITTGDPLRLTQRQIFIWTYDFGLKQNWNGKMFSIPDQVGITIRNECHIDEIKTTSMSVTFTEKTTSQAEGWSAGFDQKVDVGIEFEGIGISTQVQNTMMFGESSVSREYESQYHQERTMSMSTSSLANAYNSQLSDEQIKDSWFHPYFKDAAIKFGEHPNKHKAFDFFDDYGTHFIQEAELGGTANRNVYFHSTIDKHAAEKYFQEKSEQTYGWLWFKGGKSDSETTQTKSSDGHWGSVWTSATTIIGGDASAKTPGEFCASLEKYMTPRVLQFIKLIPIWNILEKIDGVPAGTGKKMLRHVNRWYEEGEQCALSTCKAQVSMCSWNHRAREWEAPCRCLSRAARVVEMPKCELHEGEDFRGKPGDEDLPGMPLKGISTVAMCSAKCFDTPECEFFAMNTDSHECWLKKNYTNALSGKPHMTSGQKCLSYTVEEVEFERPDRAICPADMSGACDETSGVKAKFGGWTMFKERSNGFPDWWCSKYTTCPGHAFTDHYEFDYNSDCFVWDDGKIGPQDAFAHTMSEAFDKVTVTVNVPPRSWVNVCFLYVCSEDDGDMPDFENHTNETIKMSFDNKRRPWTDEKWDGKMFKITVIIVPFDELHHIKAGRKTEL